MRFDNRILDIDVEIKSSEGQDSTGVFTADEKKQRGCFCEIQNN